MAVLKFILLILKIMSVDNQCTSQHNQFEYNKDYYCTDLIEDSVAGKDLQSIFTLKCAICEKQVNFTEVLKYLAFNITEYSKLCDRSENSKLSDRSENSKLSDSSENSKLSDRKRESTQKFNFKILEFLIKSVGNDVLLFSLAPPKKDLKILSKLCEDIVMENKLPKDDSINDLIDNISEVHRSLEGKLYEQIHLKPQNNPDILKDLAIEERKNRIDNSRDNVDDIEEYVKRLRIKYYKLSLAYNEIQNAKTIYSFISSRILDISIGRQNQPILLGISKSFIFSSVFKIIDISNNEIATNTVKLKKQKKCNFDCTKAYVHDVLFALNSNYTKMLHIILSTISEVADLKKPVLNYFVNAIIKCKHVEMIRKSKVFLDLCMLLHIFGIVLDEFSEIFSLLTLYPKNIYQSYFRIDGHGVLHDYVYDDLIRDRVSARENFSTNILKIRIENLGCILPINLISKVMIIFNNSTCNEKYDRQLVIKRLTTAVCVILNGLNGTVGFRNIEAIINLNYVLKNSADYQDLRTSVFSHLMVNLSKVYIHDAILRVNYAILKNKTDIYDLIFKTCKIDTTKNRHKYCMQILESIMHMSFKTVFSIEKMIIFMHFLKTELINEDEIRCFTDDLLNNKVSDKSYTAYALLLIFKIIEKINEDPDSDISMYLEAYNKCFSRFILRFDNHKNQKFKKPADICLVECQKYFIGIFNSKNMLINHINNHSNNHNVPTNHNNNHNIPNNQNVSTNHTPSFYENAQPAYVRIPNPVNHCYTNYNYNLFYSELPPTNPHLVHYNPVAPFQLEYSVFCNNGVNMVYYPNINHNPHMYYNSVPANPPCFYNSDAHPVMYPSNPAIQPVIQSGNPVIQPLIQPTITTDNIGPAISYFKIKTRDNKELEIPALLQINTSTKSKKTLFTVFYELKHTSVRSYLIDIINFTIKSDLALKTKISSREAIICIEYYTYYLLNNKITMGEILEFFFKDGFDYCIDPDIDQRQIVFEVLLLNYITMIVRIQFNKICDNIDGRYNLEEVHNTEVYYASETMKMRKSMVLLSDVWSVKNINNTEDLKIHLVCVLNQIYNENLKIRLNFIADFQRTKLLQFLYSVLNRYIELTQGALFCIDDTNRCAYFKNYENWYLEIINTLIPIDEKNFRNDLI